MILISLCIKYISQIIGRIIMFVTKFAQQTVKSSDRQTSEIPKCEREPSRKLSVAQNSARCLLMLVFIMSKFTGTITRGVKRSRYLEIIIKMCTCSGLDFSMFASFCTVTVIF